MQGSGRKTGDHQPGVKGGEEEEGAEGEEKEERRGRWQRGRGQSQEGLGQPPGDCGATGAAEMPALGP